MLRFGFVESGRTVHGLAVWTVAVVHRIGRSVRSGPLDRAMPLSLTDPRWSELQSSYGGTEDVVAWLTEAQQEGGLSSERLGDLINEVQHQGDTSTAMYTVATHLIDLARGATPEDALSATWILFPTFSRWPLLAWWGSPPENGWISACGMASRSAAASACLAVEESCVSFLLSRFTHDPAFRLARGGAIPPAEMPCAPHSVDARIHSLTRHEFQTVASSLVRRFFVGCNHLAR